MLLFCFVGNLCGDGFNDNEGLYFSVDFFEDVLLKVGLLESFCDVYSVTDVTLDNFFSQ